MSSLIKVQAALTMDELPKYVSIDITEMAKKTFKWHEE